MNFGQRLKSLREEKAVTQEELSNYLGVGRPTIAGYETKGKQPSFEILKKIADFFNVSIDYLLGRTNMKQLTEEQKKADSALDEISNEIYNLSPESRAELKKLIELYKLKDMQKRNDDLEIADDLTSTE